jgi:hypothetical protein
MLKLVGILGFMETDYAEVTCYDEKNREIKSLSGNWEEKKEQIFDRMSYKTRFEDLRGHSEYLKDIMLWAVRRMDEIASKQKEVVK